MGKYDRRGSTAVGLWAFGAVGTEMLMLCVNEAVGTEAVEH
jgi:hypothetical protein